jgi:hypothetical protein
MIMFMVSGPYSSDYTAAVQKVSEALEALSVINKLRIDNINFNNYILDDAYFVAAFRWRTRAGSIRNRNGKLSHGIFRIIQGLAESSPPSPSTGEEAALSAQVRAKYGTKSNDTNL